MTTNPHDRDDRTDRDQDSQPDTPVDTSKMSDNTDHPNIPDDRDDTNRGQDRTDEYEKTSRTRIVPPGQAIDQNLLEQSKERTDLEDHTRVREDVLISCRCGNTERDPDNLYTCTNCHRRACTDCHVYYSRRHYCPDCAEQKWRLDKAVYKSLYLLDEELVSVEDLLTGETVDDQPVELQVDQATATLLEEAYIHTPNNRANDALRFGDDDALTVAGREALNVGETLYSDDADVQEMKERIPLIQAAKNDR
jgi:hypothetical protein